MNPAQQKQLFQNILVKFIINLPSSQIDDPNRLAYQAEKAFYYYIDQVIKEPECANLQQARKQFMNKLVQYTPACLKIDPRKLILKIQENKPVCGAIIFNQNQTKVLVIKVRNKFGFPKGKWNQHEKAEQCAARQVQQETGVYIHNKIDPTISIEFQTHGSHTFFFVARGISQDDRLKVDKKQIDDVFWMRIEDLRANQKRLVQRSKIAWQHFQKIVNQASVTQAKAEKYQQFLAKYGPRQAEKQQEITQNPFLNFKLDKQKLKVALLSAFGE